MPTVIKVAKTSEDVDDVLKLRYRVALQQGRQLPDYFHLAERLIDHYDVYPSTFLISIYQEGRVVGSMRAMEYRPDDQLMNRAYDYRESYENLGASSYIIDMMAFDKKISYPIETLRHCIGLVLNLLFKQDIDNVFYNVPRHLFDDLNVSGLHALHEPCDCKELGYEIIPSRIHVQEFYADFVSGVADKEIIRFQDVFYKILFAPGEVLIVQGERGSTSYLIVEGEVEVLARNDNGLLPIKTIGPGQLIGEIAMITNEARTASILAKDLTCCLAFDRSEFMSLMYKEPHRSVDVFRIFSKRIQEANSRFISKQAES